MGREDDILCINFMTGARDIIGPQKSRISNTMNPFSAGSSGMCAQLVVNLMPAGSGGGNGDMWTGRAIAFVEALMKILVYMRDRGDILLDADTIRNYFHLHKLEAIALDKRFPVTEEKSVSIEDAPEIVLQPLVNYLGTLPGFDRNKKASKPLKYSSSTASSPCSSPGSSAPWPILMGIFCGPNCLKSISETWS